MQVIVLEFLDEAKAFIKKYGQNFLKEKNVLIVSLHPKVSAYLKKQNIAFRDTVEYLNNAAQHDILLKTEELTMQILPKLSLTDHYGLTKTYEETCIYHLRFYMSHFLWIIEILNAVGCQHRVEKIYCSLPNNRQKMYTNNVLLQDRERFLGFLAKDFCRLRGIVFEGLPQRHPLLKDFFVFLATKTVRTIGKILTWIDYQFLTRQEKKTVIVPALSYRMDALLKEIQQIVPDVRSVMVWEGKSTLKQELYRIYLVLDNWLKKLRKKNPIDGIISLDLINGRFKADQKLQNEMASEFDKISDFIISSGQQQFTYKGVFFGRYLTEKIERGLKEEILSLQHMGKILIEVFNRLKPQLLMSMYSNGIYFAMGEIARYLGFCSLSISHGTHVPPNNRFEEIENYRLSKSVILNDYEFVAVQTPWANRFLDYYGDKRERLFSGPLLYTQKNKAIGQKIRNKIVNGNENMRIIVHATTQKTRGGMRFHIAETLDEYLSTLSDIIHAINEWLESYLVVRPHPACDLTEEEYRLLLPECRRMSILNKGNFSKVLSVADLLVSYSSTCIEEAVQNDIPVVLFDKWKRYNHFNLEEVLGSGSLEQKPAYYLTEPCLLKEVMQKIFELRQNKEFSKEDRAYRYKPEARLNFLHFVEKRLNGSHD